MFLPGKIIESFNILNFLLKKNPMFVNVKNSDKPLLFFLATETNCRRYSAPFRLRSRQKECQWAKLSLILV